MRMRATRHTLVLLVLTSLALALAVPGHSGDSEVLDNDGIIGMVKGGLPGSIIIKKIQTSPNKFDLSTEGLVKLTSEGVPEDIIAAMMNAEANAVSEYDDLLRTLEEPGIYFLKGEDVRSESTLLEPSVIDKVKEGGFGSSMLGALTSAASKKLKAVITNGSANLQVGVQPVFLFYFGSQEAPAQAETPAPAAGGQTDPLAVLKALQGMQTVDKIRFSSMGSPNEIRLVRAEASKKDRSFVASQASGMGRESGIDSDFVRPFQFEKITAGLYRVYFAEPLEPGEYMFVYAGVALSQGQYVYDFSAK